MHILIDIQGAQNGSRHRGIGRYTRALVQKIGDLSLGRHRISLLANGAFDNIDEIKHLFSGYVHESDVHVWHPFGDPSYRNIGNDLRRKASEYLREAVIKTIAPDALIVTSAVEGCDDATVVTINKHYDEIFTATIFYDAIPAIYEDEYLSDSRSRQWYFDKIEQIKKADAILSISESSKAEAIKYFGINECKVTNISTAVSDEFCANARSAKNQQKPTDAFMHSKKYILYSGASDVRKNIPRLIEAFGMLPQSLKNDYKLVLAGGMPEAHANQLRAAAQASGLTDSQVIFTGWVSDDELCNIYAGASLFVFPSFHEGFGLPILEAMNYGIPVVASNISSIPEVVAFPDALFDPFDTKNIAYTIERALTDKTFRQALIQNSVRRCAVFSWESTARRALTVIEDAVKRKPRNVGPTAEELHVNHIIDILDSDAALMNRKDIIEPIATSLPVARRAINIFVDVSELHVRDSKTGIQRVVRNIIQNLGQASGEKYVVVPIATSLDRDYRVSNKVGFELVPKFRPFEDPVPRFCEGDIFLGLDFHDVLVPLRRNFFERMRSAGVSCYFVVYDILPLKLRQHFRHEVSKNFNAWLNFVSRSDGLIAISRAVADDIVDWMARTKIPLEKPVRVGHFKLGADINDGSQGRVRPELVDWLRVRGTSRVFVTIGTLEPRKAHAQIVGAMGDLWKRGETASLVIVGKRGWNCDALVDVVSNHSEFGQRLIWIEDASDAELLAILRAADALIAASEDEGFGLPIVEAQREGLPVIVRDIPIFREVAGNEATFFRGKKSGALANCLLNWMDSSPKLKARIASRQTITWSDSARDLADIICGNRWYTTIV